LSVSEWLRSADWPNYLALSPTRPAIDLSETVPIIDTAHERSLGYCANVRPLTRQTNTVDGPGAALLLYSDLREAEPTAANERNDDQQNESCVAKTHNESYAANFVLHNSRPQVCDWVPSIVNSTSPVLQKFVFIRIDSSFLFVSFVCFCGQAAYLSSLRSGRCGEMADAQDLKSLLVGDPRAITFSTGSPSLLSNTAFSPMFTGAL